MIPIIQSTASVNASVSAVPFPAVSAAPTHSSPLTRVTSVWSRNSDGTYIRQASSQNDNFGPNFPCSFERSVDPGLVKVNPLSEHLTTVDVKIQIVEVPRQVCMTKDNVTLNLTSVIYYQVTSPHKAAFGIANMKQALVERTQTTLRHVIGARVLQDVIERREEIAQSTSEIIEEVATGWGVQVESMLIKDIIFSNDLQDSLSMAAQSKRIGESKVIAARAEVESAKLMRQAADILSSAPAMQIRYLEAMQAMAKTANSKVIFLPATNQTVQQQMAAADNAGEGPSNYGATSTNTNMDDGFQRAMNARVIENL